MDRSKGPSLRGLHLRISPGNQFLSAAAPSADQKARGSTDFPESRMP